MHGSIRYAYTLLCPSTEVRFIAISNITFSLLAFQLCYSCAYEMLVDTRLIYDHNLSSQHHNMENFPVRNPSLLGHILDFLNCITALKEAVNLTFISNTSLFINIPQ